MSLFYKIEGSGELLNISEIERASKGNEAYGFLRKVNKKLTKENVKLSLEQAKLIQDSVNTVKNAAKKNSPKMYKLQAALNPFSKAWKIEKLSKNILPITNEVLKHYEKENTTDPYKFFDVSERLIKNMQKDDRDDDVGYVFYFEHENQTVLETYGIKHWHEFIAVPVKIDKYHNSIRLMSNKENLKPDYHGFSINYDVIQNHAKSIMEGLRNPLS